MEKHNPIDTSGENPYAVRVTPSLPRMNCLISLGLLHGSVESGVKTFSATSHQVSIILVPNP